MMVVLILSQTLKKFGNRFGGGPRRALVGKGLVLSVTHLIKFLIIKLRQYLVSCIAVKKKQK